MMKNYNQYESTAQMQDDLDRARTYGDYIAGEQADKWNRDAIGVCVMGDADSRPFSDDQMDATVKLVRLLQQAYDVPRSRVFLHTGRSADSLAPFFPAGEFRKQIRE